jgi:hypothetical protein
MRSPHHQTLLNIIQVGPFHVSCWRGTSHCSLTQSHFAFQVQLLVPGSYHDALTHWRGTSHRSLTQSHFAFQVQLLVPGSYHDALTHRRIQPPVSLILPLNYCSLALNPPLIFSLSLKSPLVSTPLGAHPGSATALTSHD